MVFKRHCCAGAADKITSSPCHCCYILNYTAGGQTTSTLKLISTLLYRVWATHTTAGLTASTVLSLSVWLCVAPCCRWSLRPALGLCSPLAAPRRAPDPASGSFPAPLGLLQHIAPGECCWPSSVWLPWVLSEAIPRAGVSLLLRFSLA